MSLERISRAFPRPYVNLRDYWRAGILVLNILKRDRAQVEVSSRCQLRCPSCPTGLGQNRKSVVGAGNLKPTDFASLLETNPSLKQLELSNWGEVVLNPDFPELLEVAHQKGVSVSVANGVNFNHVSEEALQAMVRYRLKSLRVSIDGASQETYEIYRQGGKIERVLENIRRLNQIKKEQSASHPQLTWQFVVFGHNEHELSLAREMAEELGMKFDVKLQVVHWVGDFSSPVNSPEKVASETGLQAVDRAHYKEVYGREYFVPCTQLWGSPQINWDGKLLGCCDNRWGDFGNVFESGLDEALNGPEYRRTKRALLGLEAMDSNSPCTQCYHYKNSSLQGQLRGLGVLGKGLRWLLKRT